MQRDFDRILIPRDRIAARVRELAAEIVAAYEKDHIDGLTLVTILSGSLIFLADLIRELPLRMKIGLITVSSYRGATTESRGSIILHELNTDVAGRHVLLIDDILDTGGTLRMVRQRLEAAGARSVRTCVLLCKPSKAPQDVKADFVGFDIDDVFVVGYGLDYNDLYRNFPDIGVLRKELYASS
jgi:hypoxanthine phosphoribosyltransferase